MRIGINGRFYGAPVTGVQRFGREITVRILADGDHLVLLPAGTAVADGLPVNRIIRGRLRGHLWEQVELPRRARRAQCELVLNPGSTAPLRGGPNVVVVHDVSPLTNPEWYSRRLALWYRVALGAAARRAARVLTFSRWSMAQVTGVLGVPADRIGVVTQGVEPFDAPARPADVAAVRGRLGLVGPFLLATGAGNRRKNVSFLIHVMKRWARVSPPPPMLVVVGAGIRRVHGVDREVAPAPQWLRFLGHVSDDTLRALYTGAAAFLFPSLGEGFGRPPLEAMGCGTPAVVSEYGSAREILGDAARILSLDPDEWIAAVRELVDDIEARKALVERGRCRAGSYRWGRAAREVLEGCWAAREQALRPAELVG